jgi:hypothetical protein
MLNNYSISRQEILDAAQSFRGVRFLHQGRTRAGLDCVGFLIAVGDLIKYPEIFDFEAYRRTPQPAIMRAMLEKNLDEIPVAEARPADIFWMRMGGLKPRHTAFYLNDQTDTARGIEPEIIHASDKGVRVQPLSDFPAAWFVAAFRVRGLVD